MLDIPAPFSIARIRQDMQNIEILQDLLNKLLIPFDQGIIDAISKLLECVGSRKFLALYSEVYDYLLKLKWAREGIFNTGYMYFLD